MQHDDKWDDEDFDSPQVSQPQQSGSSYGYASDGGKSFMQGQGRGYSSGAHNTKHEDNNWGAKNSDFKTDQQGPGRGSFKGGFRNNNKNDDESWGNSTNSRGFDNTNDDQWGDENKEHQDRGNRKEGRSAFRGDRQRSNRDHWENNDDTSNNSSSWGSFGDDNGNNSKGGRGNRGGDRGDGRRGRGSRGGGGGGGRNRNSEDGNGDWENNQEEGKSEPINREIYIPPQPTAENELFDMGISTGINFTKYDSIDVQVSGENVPAAISSFENSGLRPLLLSNIQRSKYAKPTPVQKHAIPIVMGGRDLMACAQTGSGKTAAFLLPIIHCLLAEPQVIVQDSQHTEPQAIIISPTRELAIQIYDEARKFSYNSTIKIVITYGGTSVGYQQKHVLNGCHILVATPGRMNDFVRRGSISFASTRFLVLDEADRMLDFGFLPMMEEMLTHTTMVPTGERRTLMFSATFPEQIQLLAAKFLENYVFVAVGIIGSACTDVEQIFYQVDKFNKRNKLIDILKNEGTEGTLVFVETKRNADFLASYLSENNFLTTSIHGDRLQREREEALREFKQGKRHILVATAVAARGLDIKNVKHVINYDLPKSIDEYVHRIGRTGRVGNRGKATSFYDDSHDAAAAADLARILKQAGQPVPDWLGSGRGSTYSSDTFGGRDVREDNNFSQPRAVESIEEAWD